jgi:hypothetical protein
VEHHRFERFCNFSITIAIVSKIGYFYLKIAGAVFGGLIFARAEIAGLSVLNSDF